MTPDTAVQSRAQRFEELLSLLVLEETSADEGLRGFVSRLLESSAQWFQADSASVFLREGDADEFILSGSVGALAHIPEGTRLYQGVGLAGQAIAEAKPQVVVGRQDGGAKSDIGSSMIVPLVEPSGVRGGQVATRCIGVLNLARGTDKPAFSKADLRLAETLGQQLALAVSNARLFAEARHMGDMLRVLLANLGFGLFAIDRLGQITHFNPEAVMLFGVLPKPGENFFAYIARGAEEIRPTLEQAASSAVRGSRSRARATYRQRVWSINATPLPSGGATIAIQDVTELEHTQREHARLKRLAEVGQMTASIAHEIRNPLTGIRSAARMIRESPDLSDEFAEIIETESIKLSGLCEDFLEFARPLRLSREAASLGPIIKHVARTLQADFDSAEVELVIDVPELDQRVMLDQSRMEQVLRNLMLNALQATAKGGRVKVSAGPFAIAVEDTGCGMDQETLGRLFSPFYTTKPQGTGLGLSTVRKILDAHEASIDVQSEPGKGTRFDIQFHQEILSESA